MEHFQGVLKLCIHNYIFLENFFFSFDNRFLRINK